MYDIRINLAMFKEQWKYSALPVQLFRYSPNKKVEKHKLEEISGKIGKKSNGITFTSYEDSPKIYLIASTTANVPDKEYEKVSENETVVWQSEQIDFSNNPNLARRIITEVIKSYLRDQGFVTTSRTKHYRKDEPIIEEVYLAEPIEYETVLLYPGFQFQVICFENKRVGIFIDRTSIMILKKTVRDTINEYSKQEAINYFKKIEYLWDCCPRFDCDQAYTGECRLSPVRGRSYRLKGLNYTLKPSKAIYPPTGESILEFNEKLCINRDKDGKRLRIIDEPPVVEMWGFNTILYFPAERLRERIELKQIDNINDRRRVMRYIRVNPKQRYEDAKNHLQFLGEIKLFGEKLEVVQDFVPGVHLKQGVFSKPLLSLYDIDTKDPVSALENYKPVDYEKREFEKLSVTLFLDGVSENMGIKKFNEITNGVRRYPGLNRYFDIETELVGVTSRIDEIRGRGKGHVVLGLVSGRGGWAKRKLYDKCFELGVGCQVFVIPKRGDRGYTGQLQNIALGIYANAGGQPWILKNSVEKAYFVGLSVLPRSTRYVYALSLVDDRGKWLEGRAEIIEGESSYEVQERYEETLAKNFQELRRKVPEDFSLVLHKQGNIYPSELNASQNIFDRILAVSRSHIGRLFDTKHEKYEAKEGTYAFVTDRKALMVTTTEMVQEGTPVPMDIQLHSRNETQQLKEQDLRSIFNLCRLHYGYCLGVSGKPLTCLVTKKVIEKVQELNIEPPSTYNYSWFM